MFKNLCQKVHTYICPPKTYLSRLRQYERHSRKTQNARPCAKNHRNRKTQYQSYYIIQNHGGPNLPCCQTTLQDPIPTVVTGIFPPSSPLLASGKTQNIQTTAELLAKTKQGRSGTCEELSCYPNV